jgi:putative transposase
VVLEAQGAAHLEDGVRDPLDQAREEIQGYLDRYHRRPHSGLGYRTPLEVRQTWEDPFRLRKEAA